MNFIFNLVLQHIIGAFEQGWKTTVCGCIVAIIGVGPKLLPLFEGKAIDQVDWSSVGGLIAGAIGLVLAKDITITKIIEGAPRAKPSRTQEMID